MNNSNLKNIFNIVFLFLFISSGTLSGIYASVCCDVDSCCQSDCCEESESTTAPIEISLSSDKNCCNINQGIQNDLERSVLFVSPSNIKASIIFSHTINASMKEAYKFHSSEFCVVSPPIHNFTLSLRI